MKMRIFLTFLTALLMATSIHAQGYTYRVLSQDMAPWLNKASLPGSAQEAYGWCSKDAQGSLRCDPLDEKIAELEKLVGQLTALDDNPARSGLRVNAGNDSREISKTIDSNTTVMMDLGTSKQTLNLRLETIRSSYSDKYQQNRDKLQQQIATCPKAPGEAQLADTGCVNGKTRQNLETEVSMANGELSDVGGAISEYVQVVRRSLGAVDGNIGRTGYGTKVKNQNSMAMLSSQQAQEAGIIMDLFNQYKQATLDAASHYKALRDWESSPK